MPNITLSIDDELHREMKAHPEIKWSEVARQALRRKVNELHWIDRAFERGGLDEDEARQLARQADAAMVRRLGLES